MGIYDDNFESTVVTMDGKPYAVVKMNNPIDISDQKSEPKGTVTLTHMIKGFDVEVMLMLDDNDDSFSFVHQIAPNVPLVVGVKDEEVIRLATEIVQRAELED